MEREGRERWKVGERGKREEGRMNGERSVYSEGHGHQNTGNLP